MMNLLPIVYSVTFSSYALTFGVILRTNLTFHSTSAFNYAKQTLDYCGKLVFNKVAYIGSRQFTAKIELISVGNELMDRFLWGRNCGLLRDDPMNVMRNKFSRILPLSAEVG